MEYNEICDVLKMGTDSGAVYSGRSYTDWGNVIRYNYFHNISNTVYEETGVDTPVVCVFLDDLLSGTTIVSNIMNNIDSGIFVNGGRDITIKNNVIVNKTSSDYSTSEESGRYAVMMRTTGLLSWHRDSVNALLATIERLDLESEAWKKYPYVNVYPADAPGAPVRDVVSENVIWNHHPIKKYSDFENYGTIKNNLVNTVNPDFVDIDNGNLNMKENSRVFSEISGFEAIPFDKIGLRN